MSHNDWRVKVKGARKRQKPKLPRAPIMFQTGGPMKDRRERLTRRAEKVDKRLDD